jgi:4-hydroxybenzoate polyprenyltransferase
MAAVLVAILYLSFLLQNIVSSALLLIATFFLAMSVYNLNKVSDLEEDVINQPERARFIKKNRDYIVFACLESVNMSAYFTVWEYVD